MRAASGYWCLPVRCVDGVLRGVGGNENLQEERK